MPEPEERPPRPSIIDAVADLLQLASEWVRQEAETTVREKIVLPLQRLGLTIASASASSCALVMGLIFIAVALFMFVGNWIGYPFAFLLVGLVYVIVSAVFLFIKMRYMVKE